MPHRHTFIVLLLCVYCTDLQAKKKHVYIYLNPCVEFSFYSARWADSTKCNPAVFFVFVFFYSLLLLFTSDNVGKSPHSAMWFIVSFMVFFYFWQKNTVEVRSLLLNSFSICHFLFLSFSYSPFIRLLCVFWCAFLSIVSYARTQTQISTKSVNITCFTVRWPSRWKFVFFSPSHDNHSLPSVEMCNRINTIMWI